MQRATAAPRRPSRRASPSARAMSAAIMARVHPAYARCVARQVGEVSVWQRPLRNAPPVEHSSQLNAAQRCSLPGPKLSAREEWCELAPIQEALSLCTAGAARTAQIRGHLRRSVFCSTSRAQSSTHVPLGRLMLDGCRSEVRTSSETPNLPVISSNSRSCNGFFRNGFFLPSFFLRSVTPILNCFGNRSRKPALRPACRRRNSRNELHEIGLGAS